MESSEITGIASNLIGLVNLVTHLWGRSRRKGKRKGRANLDAPEVRAAAGAFLECNLRLVTTVTWIADGLPPREGLLPELGADAAAKFGTLTALSDSEVLNEAALEVSKAAGEALRRFPQTEDGNPPGLQAVEHFREGLQSAMRSCGRFVAVLETGGLPEVEPGETLTGQPM